MLKKGNIVEKLKELNLPINEYWVLAGAALVLHGVKEETRDIDLGCTSNIIEKLASRGYKVKFEDDNSRSLQVGDEFEFFENWDVEEIEMIEGLPVGSLESIKKHKVDLGREKDLKDIELINQFIDKKYRNK
ncbi:MAG: hypothetical protein FH761_08580 [Firmicutes bacterium]|nr:hypothetical protein [Bacillota bacterium]